jgi:hypothetical protein
MTPKEKAKELVKKMERPMDGVSIFRLAAKKLALIAVDEIISADWYIPTFEDYKKWTSYWKEVKQEIEKL